MTKTKVLFLDRDGTIIYDSHYIRTVEQVNFIDGADNAMALAKQAGFKIVVVTNQAGIAKGIVTEAEVQEINAAMQSRLLEKHAGYDLLYYCPYHPDYRHPEYDKFQSWRKPETGMVEQAVSDFAVMGLEVDRSASYFIGDKQVDVACGLRSGVRPILVMTGYGEADKCVSRNTPPEFIAKDLTEAILTYILPDTVSPAPKNIIA